MSIFLTHYLGFPLGSKLDGVVGHGDQEAARRPRSGATARTRRPTSTLPSRCTPGQGLMTSRYAALSREELGDPRSRAAADRAAHRPVRNGAGA